MVHKQEQAPNVLTAFASPLDFLLGKLERPYTLLLWVGVGDGGHGNVQIIYISLGNVKYERGAIQHKQGFK